MSAAENRDPPTRGTSRDRHAGDTGQSSERPKVPAVAAAASLSSSPEAQLKMRAGGLTVRYGEKVAIKDVTIDVHVNQVLALIGPSGCGKSTFLRSLNRMNDTVPGVSVTGHVELDREPIYGPDVDPVLVRRGPGSLVGHGKRTNWTLLPRRPRPRASRQAGEPGSTMRQSSGRTS